jgi:hypothetical protein
LLSYVYRFIFTIYFLYSVYQVVGLVVEAGFVFPVVVVAGFFVVVVVEGLALVFVGVVCPGVVCAGV